MADGSSTGDAALDGLLGIGAAPSKKAAPAPVAPTGDAALDGLLAQTSGTPASAPSAAAPDEIAPIAPRPRGHYNINHLGTPAERTPQAWVGAGEGLLHGGTAIPAGIIGGLTAILGSAGGSQSPKGSTGADLANELSGAQNTVTSALTYHPSTPQGMQQGQLYDQVLGAPSRLIQSAIADPIKSVAPASAGPGIDFAAQNFTPLLLPAAIKGVKAIPRALNRIGAAPVQGWDTATGAPAAPTPSAAGADFGADTASAARANSLSTLPGNMQGAASAAIEKDGAYNPEAATRYSEAHEYNPGIQVSPGEATRIPEVLRDEYDRVNATARGSKRIAQNSRNFAATMEADRNAIAPDSNYTDAQLSSRTMGALRTEGNELVEDAKAAYGALEAFGNGSMPVDMDAIVRGTEADLDVSPIGGPGVRPKLGPLEAMRTKAQAAQQVAAMRAAGQGIPPDLLRQSQMTVSDYTGFGRVLAEIQRGNDPIQRYMAGAMRDQLEQLPLTQESGMPAQVQEVANTARGIWKHLKDREAEDPAFNEVRNGTPNADTFMADHFSDANGIEQVQRTLGGNDRVAQDIAAYHANRLIKAARLDADAAQTGKLAASSLGNAVRENEATLNAAFGNQGMERFQLGARVARTLTPDYASAGANISRSGTTGVQTVGRGLMNAGIDRVPGGKLARDIGGAIFGDSQQRALMRRTLDQPYAGLSMHGTPMGEARAQSNLQPRTNPNPARERYQAPPPPTPHAEPPQAPPPPPGGLAPGGAPAAPGAAARPPWIPNPLPPGPRAPLSDIGAGLQARRGGGAQARADYRARMQQIADAHIGRWSGQPAAPTEPVQVGNPAPSMGPGRTPGGSPLPAAGSVAPPFVDRSEPMSSEEWHNLVMDRMAHGAPESELQDLRRSRDAAVNREAQARFEAREWDSLRQQAPAAPSPVPPAIQASAATRPAAAPMTFEEMMKRRAPAGAATKGTDLSPFAAVKAASELPKQDPEVYAGQLEAIGGTGTPRTANAMRLAAQALRGSMTASATTTDITAARAILDGMSEEKVGDSKARRAVHSPEKLRAFQEGSVALKREFDKRNQP